MTTDIPTTTNIPNKQAHIVMLGGFLGAGKTTAILRLAQYLQNQQKSVGLITNDQSHNLVDTQLARQKGQFPVEEVAGGCFCCRFGSLIEAAEKLSSNEAPDHLIAEPVGSCTDLRATVSLPLKRLYGNAYKVAPLSVLVDPIRARRVLQLDTTKSFSPKVLYVYKKQLEEAEVIVINKRELLPDHQLLQLQNTLKIAFPNRPIFSVSARDNQGLEPWFQHILAPPKNNSKPAEENMIELDYKLYAEGEALLGWLNASYKLSATNDFDGNQTLQILAKELHQRLAQEHTEIAHLKMTIAPHEFPGDLGVLNLVRNDGQAELAHTLAAKLKSGELIINLRAEGDPDTLLDATNQALKITCQSQKITAQKQHCERFRPAPPVPTHRMAGPSLQKSPHP